MPFPFDKYPWLNFQELNLAYFIKHFREIFEQWNTLLNEMYSWKDATDAELAEWKSTVETGISSWETGLQQSMEDWKDQTEADISAWEAATLSALDAWKTATTVVFEQIRTEAAASAQAAAGSASSAQTALAGAQAAQAAAETAAAGIQSELTQIQTNTADIRDLKTHFNDFSGLFNLSEGLNLVAGYWSTSNGVSSSADTWIKTKKYMSKDIYCIISVKDINMYLQRWLNNGDDTYTYDGTWNGAEFVKDIASNITPYKYIEFHKFVADNPNHEFTISAKSDITPAPTLDPSVNGATLFVFEPIEEDIESLKTDVGNLKSDVTTIDSDIDEIQDNIDALENDQTALVDISGIFKDADGLDLISGYWHTSTGASSSADTWIKTKKYMSKDIYSVKSTNDLNMYLQRWLNNGDDTYTYDGTWDGTAFVSTAASNITPYKYIEFHKFVANNPNHEFTISAKSDIIPTPTLDPAINGKTLYVFKAITDSMLNDIAELQSDVLALESKSENNIVNRNNPVEMTAKLQGMVKGTLKSASSSQIFTKPLCIIHCSDLHGDGVCLKNIVDFKNAYSEYIDDILHTGDMIYWDWRNTLDFWNNVSGSEKILNCIGNHETRASDGSWLGYSMSECYTKYFSPYISNWGATYESGKTYYYKDYATEKVRLIVLDYMHQNSDTDQLSWFQNTLAGAITNGLAVIVAVHARPYWKLDTIPSAWDDKPIVPFYNEVTVSGHPYQANFSDTSASATNRFENLKADYCEAVQTFITNGGDFVCWLHGHMHCKMLYTPTEYPQQLVICASNAGTITGATTPPSENSYPKTYVYNRVPDTKSADDFNVVSVDTYAKIVRVIKVGANCDRAERIANSFSYNYGSGEVISADGFRPDLIK